MADIDKVIEEISENTEINTDKNANTDIKIDKNTDINTDMSTDTDTHAETKKGSSKDRGRNIPDKPGKGKKRKINPLLVVLLVILAIVIAGVLTFVILKAQGKKNLYGKAQSGGPELESIQSEEDIAEAESNPAWQKGWVRYNGDVYAYNEDILTFLVMGIDKQEEVKVVADGIKGGQADLVILAVVDPHKKTTSLITINRNTMTEIDVYDENGQYLGSGLGQLCLQHGYGDGAVISCERMVKAVSNLFYKLPIHGYISINMGAIKDINSAVGGVTITLNEDFVTDKGVYLTKGTHTLTDEQAYTFVRYRDHDAFDSASERLNREKKYIAAFISNLKEKTAKDITAPVKIFNTLAPYIVTDISTSDLTYLVSNSYDYKFDTENIYSLKGTTAIGKTEHEEFTYDQDQLYDMIINLFYEKVE